MVYASNFYSQISMIKVPLFYCCHISILIIIFAFGPKREYKFLQALSQVPHEMRMVVQTTLPLSWNQQSFFSLKLPISCIFLLLVIYHIIFAAEILPFNFLCNGISRSLFCYLHQQFIIDLFVYTQETVVSSHKHTQTKWCTFWISKIRRHFYYYTFLVCYGDSNPGPSDPEPDDIPMSHRASLPFNLVTSFVGSWIFF